MIKHWLQNRWVRSAIAFALYFPAGKLGLQLAYLHPSATPVWPPTGIALTLFLVWGFDLWPGILLGAFLVNLTTAGTVFTSLGIAIGNTLEGVLGAYLVKKYAAGRHAFELPQTIFRYTLLAGLVSTAVSATIGLTTLSVAGFAPWANYGRIWLTWWLGDMAGALIVAPFLLLWISPYVRWWNRERIPELGVLALAVLFTGLTVFGGGFQGQLGSFPLDFAAIPLIVWAAFRFGRRGAVTVSLVLSVFAIWGTLHGYGPFVRRSPNVSLMFLQAFKIVITLTGLTLAALVLQLKRRDAVSREHARRALQDSETRYRQLLESNIVAVMIVDWQGNVMDANDAFLGLVGYTRDDLDNGRVGGETLTPLEYQTADEWARVKLRESGVCPPIEKEYVRKDGTRIPVLVGVVFHEKPEQHLVCLVIDISKRRQAMTALQKAYDEMETRVTERTQELAKANLELTREVERRRRAEEALHSLAITDALTGLYNRRGFSTLANQLIRQARRARHSFMIVAVDLDGLKQINDTYGHHEGDQAVIAAAGILRDTFRKSDVIARLGGDEFAIAVHEDTSGSEEHPISSRLNDKLKDYNAHSQKAYTLSMSLGISEMKPEHRDTLEALLARADAKLYDQKRAKKTFRIL